MRGLDVIGATGAPTGIPMRVTAVDTGVYAANLMSRDGGIATAGDADPDFTLQPPAKVTAAGPPAKNAHGVAYISVTVPGHDGLFWIRQSSLAEGSGSTTAAASSAPSGPSWFTLPAWAGGPPRWQVLLGVLAGVAGLGLVAWGFSGPKPHWHRRAHG